jgi:hypothetical protein
VPIVPLWFRDRTAPEPVRTVREPGFVQVREPGTEVAVTAQKQGATTSFPTRRSLREAERLAAEAAAAPAAPEVAPTVLPAHSATPAWAAPAPRTTAVASTHREPPAAPALHPTPVASTHREAPVASTHHGATAAPAPRLAPLSSAHHDTAASPAPLVSAARPTAPAPAPWPAAAAPHAAASAHAGSAHVGAPRWAQTPAAAPAASTPLGSADLTRADTAAISLPSPHAPAAAAPAPVAAVPSTPATAARAASEPAAARRAPARAASSATRSSGRRPSRALVRVGVLGSLAAVSVVPIAQGLGGTHVALLASGTDTRSLPSTVSALTATTLGAEAPASLVPPVDAVVTRDDTVSRNFERTALAGCSGDVPDEKTSTNGHVPDRDLCTVWDGHTRVRADAALALAQLNDAFAAQFDQPICLASGYRSFTQQVTVKAERGSLAAAPGTSNHGWGLAIDLCSEDTTGARGTWIRENAPVYGWKNPAWALPGGVGPHEPWHWEYAKGVEADGEYSGY